MRLGVFFILLIALTVNVTVTSAWASHASNTQQSMTKHDNGTMPCEDMPQQQKKKSHCDGLCLCLHATSAQALSTTDASEIIPPYSLNARYKLTHDAYRTFFSSPDKRPPRIIS